MGAVGDTAVARPAGETRAGLFYDPSSCCSAQNLIQIAEDTRVFDDTRALSFKEVPVQRLAYYQVAVGAMGWRRRVLHVGQVDDPSRRNGPFSRAWDQRLMRHEVRYSL